MEKLGTGRLEDYCMLEDSVEVGLVAERRVTLRSIWGNNIEEPCSHLESFHFFLCQHLAPDTIYDHL